MWGFEFWDYYLIFSLDPLFPVKGSGSAVEPLVSGNFHIGVDLGVT